MNPAISTYLDALRIIAAGVVLFGHALAWRSLAHDAVILFFVLSGYLIAYTATERDLTGAQYAINRIARIATVAIPAVVITVLIDSYVRPLWPQGTPAFAPLDEMAKSLAVCLTMTSYIWDNSYPCFSNGPYWSLTYEVWYYVFFAAVFYPRDRRTKIIAGSAVLFIMGPKIAALMPCWLAGVAAYHIQKRWRPQPTLGLLFAGVPLVIYVVMLRFPLYEFTAIQVLGPLSVATGYMFYFSNAFLLDWLISLLIAIHVIGMIGVCGSITRPQATVSAIIKAAAGTTFSVYIYTTPLIKLVAALLPAWAYVSGYNNIQVQISLIAAGIAVALSSVTEKQKDKARTFLTWLTGRGRYGAVARPSTQDF